MALGSMSIAADMGSPLAPVPVDETMLYVLRGRGHVVIHEGVDEGVDARGRNVRKGR